MPKVLTDCVRDVMGTGKDEGSAYAICIARLGPDGSGDIRYSDKHHDWVLTKGDDRTNFPKAGDDLSVSLRNSEHERFDRAYAEDLKEKYPTLWSKGGNTRGNDAFALWRRAIDGDDAEAVTDWIREREAWAARHKADFRLPGIIAQIKWGVVGSRGETYMKRTVDEAKKLIDERAQKASGDTNTRKSVTVTASVVKASGVEEDDDERLVGCVVYEPDVEDAHGDWADAEAVKAMCYAFMEDRAEIDVQHDGEAIDATAVENFLMPVDCNWHGQPVTKGTWCMVIRVNDDDIWDMVRSGELTGFSFDATAEVLEGESAPKGPRA